MDKQLEHHINNLKSALDKDLKYNPKKVKDMLAFQISITYIDNALKKKLLSKAQFLRLVKAKP